MLFWGPPAAGRHASPASVKEVLTLLDVVQIQRAELRQRGDLVSLRNTQNSKYRARDKSEAARGREERRAEGGGTGIGMRGAPVPDNVL